MQVSEDWKDLDKLNFILPDSRLLLIFALGFYQGGALKGLQKASFKIYYGNS